MIYTSRNINKKSDQINNKFDNVLIMENTTSYNTFKDMRVYDLISTISDKPKENILCNPSLI
jgi:hypothetical protein